LSSFWLVGTKTEKIASNEIRGQNRFYQIKGLHIDSTKSFHLCAFYIKTPYMAVERSKTKFLQNNLLQKNVKKF
jgi:hypothetical protein